MYNHKDKPYHIDFCFAKPELIKHFEIVENNNFEECSDHNPLYVEFIDQKL